MKFENQKIIDYNDTENFELFYDGDFFSDIGLLNDHLIQDCDYEPGDQAWCNPAVRVKISLDVVDIVQGIFDRLGWDYEYEDDLFLGVDALAQAITAFNEANKNLKIFEPDETKRFMITVED